MRASARFLDGGFRNTFDVAPGLKKGTAGPTISEFLCGGQRRTPPGPLPSVNPLADWLRPPDTALRATWLGHSTVLLEMDGVRVLTDPVWGERASPVSFAGPKRFQPVPVTLAQLPPLDAVVIFTSLGVGAHLEAWGVAPERIHELDWWETARHPTRGLSVTAAPSQHFSGRSLGSRNPTLWSSMVLTTDHATVFFSGDTGLTPEYGDIKERLGPFDLVMLEVGAFHPAWGDIHLGPENALKAHQLLGGSTLLPVHRGTFNLAMHAWDEPAETLLSLAPQYAAQLVMPRLGQPVEPSRAEGPEAWWRPRALEKHAEESDEPPSLPPGADALPWPMD
jgi:L-ascorbate metabolism protein UlaG (beta-lactamase superfamily)